MSSIYVWNLPSPQTSKKWNPTYAHATIPCISWKYNFKNDVRRHPNGCRLWVTMIVSHHHYLNVAALTHAAQILMLSVWQYRIIHRFVYMKLCFHEHKTQTHTQLFHLSIHTGVQFTKNVKQNFELNASTIECNGAKSLCNQTLTMH